MHPVIQEFLDEGLITKEAAQRLEGFEGMLKEADFMNMLKTTIVEGAKKLGPAALGSVLGLYGADYLTNRAEKKRKEEELASMQASYYKMLNENKDLATNESQTLKRFNEISHFSPTVASMPGIAAPIVKRTLNTGLSEKDVLSLVQIEMGQRQMRSAPLKEPVSAKLLREHVPGAIKSMGEDLIQGYPNHPDAGLNPLPTGQHILEAVKILNKHNVYPPGLEGKPILGNEDSYGDFIVQNPEWLKNIIAQHGLKNEVNTATEKIASSGIFESLPMEKKATLLADQYLLLKTAAKIDIGRTLMGLGAAALFGGTAALVEEGIDYKRTRDLNKAIEDSWSNTKKNLKKGVEEQNRMFTGIAMDDKDVMSKAENAFKVLVDIAPSLAANPSVSTPFVARVIQQEGDITPDTIKVLSDVQKNINANKQYSSPFAGDPLTQGFGRGFNIAGGSKWIEGLAKGVSEV